MSSALATLIVASGRVLVTVRCTQRPEVIVTVYVPRKDEPRCSSTLDKAALRCARELPGPAGIVVAFVSYTIPPPFA